MTPARVPIAQSISVEVRRRSDERAPRLRTCLSGEVRGAMRDAMRGAVRHASGHACIDSETFKLV
ncbi:hypothetical protein E5U26_20430 [Burkholderia pseudomallei]|nr:hypothetical protein [Burkholderia pseudomallei]QBP49567.1 hypothetical protein E2R28_00745 [Burkholderia pseudomallei]QBP62845.1 hypothetical protein E2R29_00675 [Burkholderia pseudomallei]QBP69486.1 hypothetical protein E2R25_00745 [Burkholderia pseudomallei]QBR24986.1 hypothetical protein E3O37_00745 [Burkholderia pseudomallei]